MKQKPLPVGLVRARRFLMRKPQLRRVAYWVIRVAEASPSWLPVRVFYDPLIKTMSRETGPDALLRVAGALEAAGLRYWLAGGWGVDALVGRQTREHQDIDIVIDNFETNEPTARKTLEALGFRHVKIDSGGIWMPLRSTLDDNFGHKIELVGIDWTRLGKAIGLSNDRTDPAAKSEDTVARVFAVGTVDGKRVPCLSAPIQLLFHTGFHLEPGGHHNIALLSTELGTPLGDYIFGVLHEDLRHN